MASSTTVPKPSRTISDTGPPVPRCPSWAYSPRSARTGSGVPLARELSQDRPDLGLERPELLLDPFGTDLLQGVQPAEGERVLALGEGHHAAPPAELPGDDGVLQLSQHPLDLLGRAGHGPHVVQLRCGHLGHVTRPLGCLAHVVEQVAPLPFGARRAVLIRRRSRRAERRTASLRTGSRSSPARSPEAGAATRACR